MNDDVDEVPPQPVGHLIAHGGDCWRECYATWRPGNDAPTTPHE